MFDPRIFKNPSLVKSGANNALKYLCDNYGFKPVSHDSLKKVEDHFQSNQYAMITKGKILIYVSWNVYEGINFYISMNNSNLYPNKNLSMLKADLVTQEPEESYEDYNNRRKEWIMKFRNLTLLKSYKKNDPAKYVEYYLLTEIKIIEEYFPQIFEIGEYPS